MDYAPISASPFSNLDIWCNWTGNPNDAVDVSIALEVWCTPDVRLPVFNIHSPYMVGGPTFGILPKNNPKSHNKHTDADSTQPFEERPVTPTRPSKKAAMKHDALFEGDSDPSSDAESIIINPEPPEEQLIHPVDISVLYTQANVSLSEFSTPSKSPNPRKRTAKAASLPDSIPDSDRGGQYDGDGLTVTSVKPMLAPLEPLAKVPSNNSYNSCVSHRSLPIRITRPASLDETDILPENVPLPSDSAPVSAAEYRRYEPSGKFCKRVLLGGAPGDDLPEDAPEEDAHEDEDEEAKGLFDAWASLGTHDKDYSKCTPQTDEKEQQKLDAFSTTVSPGNSSRFGGGKQDSLFAYESDSSSSIHDDGDIYGVPLARLFTPRHSPAPDSNAGAQLIIIEDTLYVQTSPTILPATYQLSISVSIQVKQGSKDWWELALAGLPRLRPDEYGYLYFLTPPGQGMEFRTTVFKRSKVADNYLIAQFVVSPRFVIPFRTCDAQFYGFLKDFKVNQLIQFEVKEDDNDPLCYVVKYRALCSIELIQRDFWAEKCSFYLYVHGGPDGEYTSNLQSNATGFQTIKLDPRPNTGFNNSQVLITCSRSNLSMFVLAWEVRLPYHAAVSWMPQIKTTSEVSEAEMKLRLEYAQAEPESDEVVEAKTVDVQKGVPQRESVVTFVEPNKPHRVVQGLWTLWAIVSFLFQLITILASFTIIYSCSWRNGAGFLSQLNGGYSLVCPRLVSVNDMPVVTVNFTEEWPVTETFQLEDFEPETVQPETVQPETVQPEPVQSKTQLATFTPLSLRDRVDYLLGWRGPIEKN
ncbi:hypothetical protein N7467_005094 [Penicillium canescens]|nr:hypothetical protein N7467_005094 [Penicillium canescens]